MCIYRNVAKPVKLFIHDVCMHCIVNRIFAWDRLPRNGKESLSFEILSDLTLKLPLL